MDRPRKTEQYLMALRAEVRMGNTRKEVNPNDMVLTFKAVDPAKGNETAKESNHRGDSVFSRLPKSAVVMRREPDGQ